MIGINRDKVYIICYLPKKRSVNWYRRISSLAEMHPNISDTLNADLLIYSADINEENTDELIKIVQ